MSRYGIAFEIDGMLTKIGADLMLQRGHALRE
jgi:hypothetical protein